MQEIAELQGKSDRAAFVVLPEFLQTSRYRSLCDAVVAVKVLPMLPGKDPAAIRVLNNPVPTTIQRNGGFHAEPIPGLYWV